MYSATAYNHAYNDTGLFCIHASAPPNYVRDMVEVIVKELVNMASSIGDQELRVCNFLSASFLYVPFLIPSCYKIIIQNFTFHISYFSLYLKERLFIMLYTKTQTLAFGFTLANI